MKSGPHVVNSFCEVVLVADVYSYELVPVPSQIFRHDHHMYGCKVASLLSLEL